MHIAENVSSFQENLLVMRKEPKKEGRVTKIRPSPNLAFVPDCGDSFIEVYGRYTLKLNVSTSYDF